MILPINDKRRLKFTKDEVQIQKRTFNEDKQNFTEWASYKYCATSAAAARLLMNEGYAAADALTLDNCLMAARDVANDVAQKFDIARLEK
jgi:hypothetical protein|tara:strand:- start:4813 stop:5082 length:270 start_codon:yes stop_codon:yes gene_type:complete